MVKRRDTQTDDSPMKVGLRFPLDVASVQTNNLTRSAVSMKCKNDNFDSLNVPIRYFRPTCYLLYG